MDILASNLGATEAELQSLHSFAQEYLKQKADREAQKAKELEDMRSELSKTGEQFSELYAGMENNKTVSTPIDGESHFVVKKSIDRLRMAITTNPEKDLSGWSPEFNDISEFQEVAVIGFRMEKPIVGMVNHWDKDQLDKIDKGGSFWGLSNQIQLGDFSNVPADVVVQSFENAKVIMRVPQSLLDSAKK